MFLRCFSDIQARPCGVGLLISTHCQQRGCFFFHFSLTDLCENYKWNEWRRCITDKQSNQADPIRGELPSGLFGALKPHRRDSNGGKINEAWTHFSSANWMEKSSLVVTCHYCGVTAAFVETDVVIFFIKTLLNQIPSLGKKNLFGAAESVFEALGESFTPQPDRKCSKLDSALRGRS